MDYIIEDFCKALSVNLGIDIERIYLVWNQLNEKYLNQLIKSEEEIPRSYPVDENLQCSNTVLREYYKKHVLRNPFMPKIEEE